MRLFLAASRPAPRRDSAPPAFVRFIELIIFLVILASGDLSVSLILLCEVFGPVREKTKPPMRPGPEVDGSGARRWQARELLHQVLYGNGHCKFSQALRGHGGHSMAGKY